MQEDRNSNTTKLLGLPLEIRELIYSFIGIKKPERTLNFRLNYTSPIADPTYRHAFKALNRSCRQLHDELYDLVYPRSRFHFHISNDEMYQSDREQLYSRHLTGCMSYLLPMHNVHVDTFIFMDREPTVGALVAILDILENMLINLRMSSCLVNFTFHAGVRWDELDRSYDGQRLRIPREIGKLRAASVKEGKHVGRDAKGRELDFAQRTLAFLRQELLTPEPWART